MAAVRAGDKDALAVLYQTYRADALSFARALARDPYDAEDIFHEAFTKIIKAITNGAGPSENFLAYLYTTVRSTAVICWKRRSREHSVEPGDIADNGAAPDPRLDAIDDQSAHDKVLVALQSLPERWQKVLWYTDVLQHKPRHIAPLMRLTPNAVSALVNRARQGLRTAYTDIPATSRNRHPVSHQAPGSNT